MRVRYTALLTALLLTSCAPALAQSDDQCGPKERVYAALMKKYQEMPIFGGYFSQEVLVSVWFSKDKKTWTILKEHPDGKVCILSSGTDGYIKEPRLPLQGDPL